jgi:hypothetical protein
MKRSPWLIAILFSVVTAFAGPPAHADVPRYKLLLQVTEDSVDKLRLALKHAQHAQDELGRDNIEIELVAWGPGVNTFRYYTPLGDELKEAHYRGVRLVICEKSMRGAKLRIPDMIQTVNLSYVPSGLAEAVVRQSEGWTYAAP